MIITLIEMKTIMSEFLRLIVIGVNEYM